MPIIPAGPRAITDAARLLRGGSLVAFPTETVYGLGADAENGLAVAAIYAAKGRPSFNPLIVHVADVAAAWRLGTPSPVAEALAEAFWPGPLTMVLPLRAEAGISALALAGLTTIAIRVPSHPVAQALLRETGRPLAAPSANRSGRISPTTAAHVAADFDEIALVVIDGGETQVGLESTILNLSGTQVTMLRPGGVTRAAIEAVIGEPLVDAGPGADGADPLTPSAPGQLASHYAPRAAVRCNASETTVGEALLAFGTPILHDGPTLNLSQSGDLVEAAAALFAHLRALDASGAAIIAVMPIPESGLGEAINDRLRRAAAPRNAVR